MRVKKKKQKATYAVVEISNASDKEVGHYYLGRKSFKALQSSARKTMAMGIVSIVLAVGILILGSQYVLSELGKKNDEIAKLTAQIEALSSEKDEIQGNLDEKITAEKEQEAMNALLYIPNNYPVTGASTVRESNEVVALDAVNTSVRPWANFEGSEGATVVAAGAGKVLSVEEHAGYGFKLTIDHGNGYISLYYNGGNPMVEQGDEVTKDTVLFKLGSHNKSVAFQIIENGTYISPLSMVDIQG